MPVYASDLPSESQLSVFRRSKDFMDCYEITNIPTDLCFYDVVMKVATEGPKWANNLLKLRNKLVGPLGLKTGEILPPVGVKNKRLKPGDRLGIFKVYAYTENEVICGEDDIHLDFRVSIYREGASVFMATWVQPHNMWGWSYLGIVMPFHKLIVRSSLACLKK